MQKRVSERIMNGFKEFIDEKAEEYYLKINEILENHKVLICSGCKQNKVCDIQITHVMNNGCRLFIDDKTSKHRIISVDEAYQ